ncbi:MAG: LysE family translocator [Nocardioides sp.]
MPSVDALVAFAVASVILIAIPGPSVLFVVGRALTLGRRGALLSVLGNALGVFLLVLAVATGVGSVVAESLLLFSVLKLCGAAYLVYLGVQAIRHRNEDTAVSGVSTGVEPGSRWTILRQGVTVGVTNPKAAVFFVAVLPQFVDFRAADVTGQMVVFGLVFTVIALVSDSVWAVAAGAAGTWLATSPGRIAAIRATGGGMMIGLGGTLALTGPDA